MESTDSLTRIGGGGIRRQLSFSHIQPKKLADYENFFRQNSSREAGWLLMKGEFSENWNKKYVILEDGVFTFSSTDDGNPEDYESISMDTVVSWRTNSKNRLSSEEFLTMTTAGSRKIYLKTEMPREMNRWIFAIQKSVALVLTQIIESNTANIKIGGTDCDMMTSYGDSIFGRTLSKTSAGGRRISFIERCDSKNWPSPDDSGTNLRRNNIHEFNGVRDGDSSNQHDSVFSSCNDLVDLEINESFEKDTSVVYSVQGSIIDPNKDSSELVCVSSSPLDRSLPISVNRSLSCVSSDHSRAGMYSSDPRSSISQYSSSAPMSSILSPITARYSGKERTPLPCINECPVRATGDQEVCASLFKIHLL